MTHWSETHQQFDISGANTWSAGTGKWGGSTAGNWTGGSHGGFTAGAGIPAYAGTGMLSHAYRIGDWIYLKKITVNISVQWNQALASNRRIFIAVVQWIKPEGASIPTTADVWNTAFGAWWTNPTRDTEHVRDFRILKQRTLNYSLNVSDYLTKLAWTFNINKRIKYVPQVAQPGNAENLGYHLFILPSTVDGTNFDVMNIYQRVSFYP